ncbi:MAG: hypothetical protein ACI9DC_004288 [Gammaproteobacteria bacterium]|jgi:hypothetical protein
MTLPSKNEVGADGIITQQLAPPLAWKGRDVQPEDWLLSLPDECIDELCAVIDDLRDNPLPTLVLTPQMFSLEGCVALTERLRRMIHEGMGVVVLDRLPLDLFSQDEAIACYWLLGSLLARPVAQAFDGRLLYDVRDVGQNLRFQEGVRASITTDGLSFHSDAAYATTAPSYLGLLCLQTPKAGGISRLVSLLGLHNYFLDRYPELLPRCYDSFPFSQGKDHRPGEEGILHAPLFGWDVGGFRGRIHSVRIRRGFTRASTQIDAAGERVLDVIEEFVAEQENWLDMTFEPGQMQFVNNNTIGHSRSAFEDWPEEPRKRHLVRLWLRDYGRRSFYG